MTEKKCELCDLEYNKILEKCPYCEEPNIDLKITNKKILVIWEFNNGYTCSCCRHTWKEEIEFNLEDIVENIENYEPKEILDHLIKQEREEKKLITFYIFEYKFEK